MITTNRTRPWSFKTHLFTKILEFVITRSSPIINMGRLSFVCGIIKVHCNAMCLDEIVFGLNVVWIEIASSCTRGDNAIQYINMVILYHQCNHSVHK